MKFVIQIDGSTDCAYSYTELVEILNKLVPHLATDTRIKSECFPERHRTLLCEGE